MLIPLRRSQTRPLILPLVALSLALAGCSSGKNDHHQPTPEVGYRVVHPSNVALETELQGRVDALRTAEVRPQINGVITKRLFTEGALVRAGQPLYQIDPSLYRAASNQASANLSSARATAAAAVAKADRYKPLAAAQAVSQQDYADALAAAKQAKASISQNKAALETAKINLNFTTVPAPITGRIGRSLFTEGALATSGQADPLAVISVLDPINVDLQQSASDLIRLRKQLASGGVAATSARVRLLMDDGSDYGMTGQVQFTEVTTDPSTGTVTLRAQFPNPQGLLMPGMFVRAKVAQATSTNAFLVPQSALTRDNKGQARVYVLGADNKVETRTVTTSQTQGSDWVVTGGLRDGDRLITQGLGHIKPGQAVKAVPETTEQKVGGGHGPGGHGGGHHASGNGG